MTHIIICCELNECFECFDKKGGNFCRHYELMSSSVNFISKHFSVIFSQRLPNGSANGAVCSFSKSDERSRTLLGQTGDCLQLCCSSPMPYLHVVRNGNKISEGFQVSSQRTQGLMLGLVVAAPPYTQGTVG